MAPVLRTTGVKVSVVMMLPAHPGQDLYSEWMEASAGFEPAVEVLQPANRRSLEFAEVRGVFEGGLNRSAEFILVRQSSARLPSPLPSNRGSVLDIS